MMFPYEAIHQYSEILIVDNFTVKWTSNYTCIN